MWPAFRAYANCEPAREPEVRVVHRDQSLLLACVSRDRAPARRHRKPHSANRPAVACRDAEARRLRSTSACEGSSPSLLHGSTRSVAASQRAPSSFRSLLEGPPTRHGCPNGTRRGLAPAETSKPDTLGVHHDRDPVASCDATSMAATPVVDGDEIVVNGSDCWSTGVGPANVDQGTRGCHWPLWGPRRGPDGDGQAAGRPRRRPRADRVFAQARL